MIVAALLIWIAIGFLLRAEEQEANRSVRSFIRIDPQPKKKPERKLR